MGRTARAFLIAPLWVPAAITFLFALTNHHPGPILFIGLHAFIVVYGGTLIFGLPLFLILRRLGIIWFWVAPVGGFVIAIVTWFIFSAKIGSWLGGTSFHSAATQLLSKPAAVEVLWFAIVGTLGALIGGIFWRIARPDLPVEISGGR